MLGPKKDNVRTRFYTLINTEYVRLNWFESILYLIKSYICEWLNRYRKPNWNKDQYTYHYGKVSSNHEGFKHWSEKAVESGLFRGWYVNHYENGE